MVCVILCLATYVRARASLVSQRQTLGKRERPARANSSPLSRLPGEFGLRLALWPSATWSNIEGDLA